MPLNNNFAFCQPALHLLLPLLLVLNVTEKVSHGVRTSMKTVTESAKIHVFPMVSDSMRAEASKLQTQEKKVTTRKAQENQGGCSFSCFLVAKLAMESKIM
jgi:hypothetical protein